MKIWRKIMASRSDYNEKPILFNQLKGIIETWKETGYPDSPGAYGCKITLERLYEGRYDVEAAEYLTDLIFNKEK